MTLPWDHRTLTIPSSSFSSSSSFPFKSVECPLRPSPIPASKSASASSLSPSPLLSLSLSPFRSFSSIPQVGAPLRKKVTSVDLSQFKQKGKKISMVTAYTYPSAVHVDAAGIDVILVGDSVGMVELGYDTTLPVTMEDMLHHCKSVARGSDHALLVADMPFGSYETSPEHAYMSAIRFLKEAQMDCVKLEGGKEYVPTIRKLVAGGVAVMGHIGLTPQRISVLGGFRAQGKSLQAAQALLEDAIALQEAGCFAIVIECVPAEVAEFITQSLTIPTIGIGAGNGTSGQVLVYHDLLGMFEHAHHAKVSPSFCKTYGRIGSAIQEALNEFKAEVETEAFPGQQYSPYKFNQGEKDKFEEWKKVYQQTNKPTKEDNHLAPDETIKVY